jgi:hypothetical protein
MDSGSSLRVVIVGSMPVVSRGDVVEASGRIELFFLDDLRGDVRKDVKRSKGL